MGGGDALDCRDKMIDLRRAAVELDDQQGLGVHRITGMNEHCLPAGPIQTNAYLITEPGTGQAVLIDAPLGVWAEAEPVLRSEGCRLAALWLTHGHWDHTQGAAEVVRKARVPVSAHRADQPLYETPEMMRPPPDCWCWVLS